MAFVMLFGNPFTNTAQLADVRTYWSPESVYRVSGFQLEGKAKEAEVSHTINSGALPDARGEAKDERAMESSNHSGDV